MISKSSHLLEIKEIKKDYEGKPLLRGVSFHVAKGETLCILGPSGSGKSTLLKIIAGIETPKSGQVIWEGQNLENVPAHKRNFGLMFQDYALFPHRNVLQNVAFGLRMQNLPSVEIEKRVEEMLQKVEMQSFAKRKVTDLSGGEQQRVALARALAPRPRLLMLDEPLGALDRNLREQLTKWLRRLLHENHIPAIYVTHDQEEAFNIADRILLLHEGQVVQEGSPEDVYRKPANTWVADFLGIGNLLEGTVISQKPLKMKTILGEFEAHCGSAEKPAPGAKVALMFPQASARLKRTPGTTNQIKGVVVESIFHGNCDRITINCTENRQFEFDLPSNLPVAEKVTLYFQPEDVLCLA